MIATRTIKIKEDSDCEPNRRKSIGAWTLWVWRKMAKRNHLRNMHHNKLNKFIFIKGKWVFYSSSSSPVHYFMVHTTHTYTSRSILLFSQLLIICVLFLRATHQRTDAVRLHSKWNGCSVKMSWSMLTTTTSTNKNNKTGTHEMDYDTKLIRLSSSSWVSRVCLYMCVIVAQLCVNTFEIDANQDIKSFAIFRHYTEDT